MAFKNTNDFKYWFIRELENYFFNMIWELKKGSRMYFFIFKSFLPIYIYSQLIHSFQSKKAVDKESIQFAVVRNYWLTYSPNWHWDHPTQQSSGVLLSHGSPEWFCNAPYVNQEHFSGFYCISNLFLIIYVLIKI